MSTKPGKTPAGYYLRFRGQTSGPYTLMQIREGLTSGTVSRLHDISRDQARWYPIHTRPAILSGAEEQPSHEQPVEEPPAPAVPDPVEQTQNEHEDPEPTPAPESARPAPATRTQAPPVKTVRHGPVSRGTSEKDLPALDASGNEDIIERILKEKHDR